MLLKRLQEHQTKPRGICNWQNCYGSWGNTRGFPALVIPFHSQQQSMPVVDQRAGLSLLLCHLHSEPLHLPLLPSGSASYLSRPPAAVPVLFQHWARECSFLLTRSQAGLLTLYLKGFIFLQALCKSVPRRTCQKGWEELWHFPLAVPNILVKSKLSLCIPAAINGGR